MRATAKSEPPNESIPAAIEEELWFGGHDSSVAEDAAARSMAALVGRIVGAKPFPESARRLAELTRKEVIRIEPVVQVLERDPALSVRLLRLVNSAGYALRQRCTSVRHAATLVGTDRLHQIATTAAVLDLFDSRGSIAAKIVEHSTIVGAFCRYFGAHLALPVDDLFTAGFLHDIGKLMLLETEGDQYFSLLEKYLDKPDTIHVVERSLYGFDHAVLAAHVLTAWNIPDPVPKIVAWHHDPTRAYRVSSMMAALVQTVRLADVAVCAMVSGVEQKQFATLASTEAASYLDISEPQLDSMWEELQTLYRESLEQCRGENAPALDPRSLRPKQPLSLSPVLEEPRNTDTPRSTELPLQFPCVVCGHPTFGNKCRACGGHMCPEHQVGRDDWCTLCARDFTHVESEAPQAMSPRIAVLVGFATIAISTAIGYETGGARGGLRAGIGTILLIALAVLLAVAGRRLLLRFRFVRTRPNRAIEAPQVSDGGTLSLVPPTTGLEPGGLLSRQDPLAQQLRISGAALDRVMIREVPSVPSIIAPRPFDGLTEASPPSSRRRDQLPSVRTSPDNADAPPSSQQPESIDHHRVTLQGQSLVTLPVPADPASHESSSYEMRRPIKPTQLIEIESDDRISELGLNGLDATPSTDAPLPPSNAPERPQEADAPINPAPVLPIREPSSALPPPREDVVAGPVVDRIDPGQPHRSGTYRSSPPVENVQHAKEEPDSGSEILNPPHSLHPLAALGIATPGRNSKRPTSSAREQEIHSESKDPNSLSGAVIQSERNTLLGMSAEAVARAFAGGFPDPSERSLRIDSEPLDDIPRDTPAFREPALDDIRRDAPTFREPARSDDSLDSLQQRLDHPVNHAEAANISTELNQMSEAPERAASSPHAPGSEAANTRSGESEAGAIAPLEESAAFQPPREQAASAEKATASPMPALGDLERQLLASMGPEFQAKILSLVADRVAAIVAERMLETLGQSGNKVTPPGSPRAARGRRPQSAKSRIGEPEKQKRRKAQ